jgi:ribA/ribD-fused uncharacterized protein
MVSDRAQILNPPLTIEALMENISKGMSPKYLHFWGHRAKAGEVTGKHVLSQWWPCRFVVDGVQYPSAEHFMMAEKARMFDDAQMLESIFKAPNPGAAKALGRKVRNFSLEKWEAGRFDVVIRGSLAKFGQNPDLSDYLLATGRKVLVEASPIDKIWGIGLAADDARAEDPRQWRGLNLLGFALMKARAVLLAAQLSL